MALKKAFKIGIVNFIHPDDGAIDTGVHPETGELISDIEAYKDDWDFEKHCVLKEDVQPTIFKINFNVSYKRLKAMKNSTLGGDGKKEEFGFKLGNLSFQTVRTVLVDILNPPGTELADMFVIKRDKDQLVSMETMEELERYGFVDDIFSFYNTVKSDPEMLKKK